MPHGELDGPREGAGVAIATACHEAADASEGMAQGHAWREGVGDLPERYLLESSVEDGAQRGSDEASVEDQAALPNFEDFPKLLAGEVIFPIRGHIEGSRADKGSHDNPGAEIRDLFGREPVDEPSSAGCPKTREKTQRDTDAVPMNAKISD